MVIIKLEDILLSKDCNPLEDGPGVYGASKLLVLTIISIKQSSDTFGPRIGSLSVTETDLPYLAKSKSASPTYSGFYYGSPLYNCSID